MKRTLWICLICCLVAALMIGCGAKTTQPEASAEATPAAEGEAAAPANTTDIVRLESIDYDEATKGLKLSLTKGVYAPAADGEEEYEYTITYGETVTAQLAPDATIDFPMVDDLARAVTITADELTGEFVAYMEQMDDKPLFTMEQDGDVVKTLTYFYLP